MENSPGAASERTLELLLGAIPDNAQFSQRCGAVNDWDQVFHWALTHGVESVLHHHLIEVGYNLPSAMEDRVHRWQVIKDLWQEHAECALDEALRVLNSAGVPVVV